MTVPEDTSIDFGDGRKCERGEGRSRACGESRCSRVLLGSPLTLEFAIEVPPGYRIHFPSAQPFRFP